MKTAKFNIGERVIHRQLGYRAIIIDADSFFQPSRRHNPRAMKREFATRQPWYRLLVDGSSQMTYVEECLLKKDTSIMAINNPKIESYLKKSEGAYLSNATQH